MQISSRHHHAGFGLVEALVSLVVISVGMIGIAALYGQGLRASGSALYRTIAVNLASDMADRIRVNRRGGPSYGGAAANGNCDPGGNTDCTVAAMASHDLFTWQAQVAAQLPAGAGQVLYAGTTPATYTIRVNWTETSVGAVTHQITVRVPNL
jgi:type IV pilus assembly protein PilV